MQGENLLQAVLAIVLLAIASVRCQLYHGFASPMDDTVEGGVDFEQDSLVPDWTRGIWADAEYDPVLTPFDPIPLPAMEDFGVFHMSMGRPSIPTLPAERKRAAGRKKRAVALKPLSSNQISGKRGMPPPSTHRARKSRSAVVDRPDRSWEAVEKETKRLMQELTKKRRAAGEVSVERERKKKTAKKRGPFSTQRAIDRKRRDVPPMVPMSAEWEWPFKGSDDRVPIEGKGMQPPMHVWRGGHKKKRNRVGRPIVKVERIPDDPLYTVYSSRHKVPMPVPVVNAEDKPPFFDPEDPLANPWIRLGVACALGALVTFSIFIVSSLICALFPSFFGYETIDSGKVEEEAVFGRGVVRYVPVPTVKSAMTDASTLV